MADHPSSDKKFPYETIEEIELKSIPPPEPVQKKRTAKEKLGTYNIIVLTIGTIIILLGIGFLAFVWAISINNAQQLRHLPRLWILIVANKWVSRVVTLCSILIRVATAAQLCVFAAIMAALILERVGASTEDLPLLSMMRCANTGPQALIWNVLRTLKTGQQLGYSSLIVLAILNALALQFTSTILLADLGQIEVVLNSYLPLDVHYGMAELTKTNPYSGVDFWKTGPQVYPRFAEHKSPASNGTNFADTGKTYRGFLPFDTPLNRDHLRFYNGPMEVFDSRVLCVAPKLSKLSIWSLSDEEDADHIISGTLDITGIHPDLSTKLRSPGSQNRNKDYVINDFNCTAPAVNFEGNVVGNASICILTYQYGRLLDGIVPEDSDEEEYPMGKTLAHLVINATSVHDEYRFLSHNSTLTQMQSTTNSWSKFGNKNMTFDLSLCFFRPESRDYEVYAWSEESWMDAQNEWDNSTGEMTLDTTWTRGMLDADLRNLTPAERGLLTIDPPANWTAAQTKVLHNVTGYPFIMDSVTALKSLSTSREELGGSYLLTPWVMPENAIHRSHATLVSHILRNTSNPAVAMQALWTVLLQMSYYDFYGDYDLHANAEVGISDFFLIPYKWNCFAAVMGLMGLHFVVLITGSVLFLTRTEMSLLGNSWQAISQVMSTDTANTIHHSKMATDDEVKETVKKSSNGDERMRITRCDTSGRTEAVSVLRRRREDAA